MSEPELNEASQKAMISNIVSLSCRDCIRPMDKCESANEYFEQRLLSRALREYARGPMHLLREAFRILVLEADLGYCGNRCRGWQSSFKGVGDLQHTLALLLPGCIRLRELHLLEGKMQDAHLRLICRSD